MTSLRPILRPRRSLFSRGSLSFSALATVGLGLLLPGSSLAAPHAHARRPLATPLHVSAVTETGRHAQGSRHGSGHGGSHAGAVTHPGHVTTAKPASKGSSRPSRKGKAQHPAEPDEEPVPMFRARRGTSPGGSRGAATPVALSRNNRLHGHMLNSPAAEKEAKGRQRTTAGAVHSASRFDIGTPLAGQRVFSGQRVSSRKGTNSAHTHADTEVEIASRSRNESPAAPIVRSQPYAEGVARPAEGPPLHRSLTPDAGTPAILNRPATAHVSAAPSVPVNSAAPSRVVQGFGSELAVPPASGEDRPANTHRRNHPSNWTPEAMLGAPELLEDREAITAAAVSPAVLPESYDRNGRLVMPAPLRGSHEILVHQNLMATSDGLERIQDDADLDRLRYSHQLVSFPVSESLRVNEDLPQNHRYARPWTVQFAADLGRAFYARFHQPIQINSAVRTVRYQARLQMINGNAAATYGDGASPHLTGQAIDIAKRWMSHEEIAWIRGYLAPWMQGGKIDVEEEFQQACFHISVYRSYGGGRRLPVHQVAQVKPNAHVPAAGEEVGGPDPATEEDQ